MARPTLSLREHQPTFGVNLTLQQRDQLAKVVAIRPSEGLEQTYDLTPGSTVGSLRLVDLDVVIEPKVPRDRVLFLLSYALGRIDERGVGPPLEAADDLVEAVVQAFVAHTKRALLRG